MKMRATVEVEFEADSTAPNPTYALEVALERVKNPLVYTIERGTAGKNVPTGIRRDAGTTKVNVIKQEIA
jgi:hypothetical protein